MMKIFFCGDIVLSKKGPMVDDKILEIIRKADFGVCNFEAPVESGGEASPKAGPSVKQPPFAVELLSDTGLTHFCLANNHIMDYGRGGLDATLAEAGKHGITCFGAAGNFEDAYAPLIVRKDNLSAGLLAYTEYGFGICDNEKGSGTAHINHPQVYHIIKSLKEKVDFLVINVHAGLEEYNTPLPLWRDRYRELCDFGADVIIGHHPHVPQGWEDYRDSRIFYSLGNFKFDWGEYHDENKLNYSVLLTFPEKGKKDFEFEIVPHKSCDDKVQLCDEPESTAYLESLCRGITSERLTEESDEECSRIFRQSLLKYLKMGCGAAPSNGAVDITKSIVKSLVRDNSSLTMEQALMLFHMLGNETNRYVALRALKKFF